jgi:hypothetical protein
VSCQLTHSYFHAIIKESIILSYLKATDFVAVKDNPHSKLSVIERLALLKNQEDAWQDFGINFKQVIKVGYICWETTTIILSIMSDFQHT